MSIPLGQPPQAGSAQHNDSIPSEPTRRKNGGSNGQQYPWWILPISGALILLLLSVIGFFFVRYFDHRFDSVIREIERVDKTAVAVDERLKALNDTFVQFKHSAEGEDERLRKSIETIKRTLPKEVQENIETILKKISADFEREQRVLSQDVKTQVRHVEEQNRLVKAEYEKTQQRVTELEHEIGKLDAFLLEAEAPAYKARAEQAASKTLEPILSEWESAREYRNRGEAIPPGFGFVPSGASLSTKPYVRIAFSDSVVSITGTVPSENARAALIEAVKKVLPKRALIDPSELRIDK